MALANRSGEVVSLPVGDEAGFIKLDDETMVAFTSDDLSKEFGLEEVGPIAVGKKVKVWAVKLPIDPTYTARWIESNVEPLEGNSLLAAMTLGDNSLACKKGMLDSMIHANIERQNEWLEKSWANYSEEPSISITESGAETVA